MRFNKLYLRNEDGQAMIETLIVLPVVLFFILMIMEVAMLYNAKQIVNYAGFCAARTGSVFGVDERNDTLIIYRAAALALSSISPKSPPEMKENLQSTFEIPDDFINKLPHTEHIPLLELQERFFEAYLRTKVDSVKLRGLNITVFLTYYYRCRILPMGKIIGSGKFENYISNEMIPRYPSLSEYLSKLLNMKDYNIPVRSAILLDYWAGE